MNRLLKIVFVVVLLLPLGVKAQKQRRIQIPAHPFWITLPDGWKSQADTTDPIVSVRDKRGGRMVFRGARADQVNLLALEMKRIEKSYGPVQWKQSTKKNRRGHIQRGARPLRVAISEIMAGGYRLLATAIAPPERSKAVFELLTRALGSMQYGWAEPAKRWRQIPGSDLQIQLPDTGWQENPSIHAVKLQTPDGNASFEAHVRHDEGGKPGLILDSYARSLSSAGQWAWSPNQAWNHKLKGKGIKRQGSLSTPGSNKEHSVVLYAYKSGKGIVFIIATVRGASAAPILKQIAKIAASLTSSKKR